MEGGEAYLVFRRCVCCSVSFSPPLLIEAGERPRKHPSSTPKGAVISSLTNSPTVLFFLSVLTNSSFTMTPRDTAWLRETRGGR